MIYGVNYANDLYRDAQVMNTRTAYENGVDKVFEYTFESLPDEFIKNHSRHFACSRGNGLWIWKPYVILDALSKIEDNDYLIYIDSGAAYVNNVSYLIDAMEDQNCDIMPFVITPKEKQWSKRDAFILMECDSDEIAESPQICGGYIVIKKSNHSVRIMEEYLRYASDYRIVSEDKSVLGKDYAGFVENRHDQTVWSLLCKKEGILPFRDPSEFGLNPDFFSNEVNNRSTYPQIVESHRLGNIRYKFELAYKRRRNPLLYVCWIMYRIYKKGKRIVRKGELTKNERTR